MNRNGIFICLTTAACGAVGALAWHATDRPFGLRGLPNRAESRDYVRIELPAVKVVQPDQISDVDASLMLRESIDRDESLPVTEAVPPPALAADMADTESGPTKERVVTRAPVGALEGMLAVSYDLSDETGADREMFEIRKGVRFNGRDAGQATIRVGSGATLLIASQDLRTLLAAADRTDLVGGLLNGQQSFIGFDQVRETGLNVRYDAVSDRILISS